MSYRVNLIGPRSSYGIPGSVTPVAPAALPTPTKTLRASDYPFSGYSLTGNAPTVDGSALVFNGTTLSKATNEVARPFTMAISVELTPGSYFGAGNANVVMGLDYTSSSIAIYGNQDTFDSIFYTGLVPGGRLVAILAFDGTSVIAMPRGYSTQIVAGAPPVSAGVSFQAYSGTPKLYEVRFYNSWIGTSSAQRVLEDLYANP